MQRALELARLGMGNTSPNPMVGAVITRNQEIIGEGWHHQYGSLHAEVNAINDVQDTSLLKNATMYVTLEPCDHYGQTPPCTDLIIKHKIGEVIICNTDPNPEVNGKGIEKLRSNGIKVETGILEREGKQLNKRFFCYHEQKRPYIILKWAETQDKFIANKNYESGWISGPFSRKIVHKWRNEEDAIMAGYRTACHDNPKLTVRDWQGNNPLRLIYDKKLSLSQNLSLFNTDAPTLIYNHVQSGYSGYTELVYIDENIPVNAILNDLYQRKIQSVIIEGGAQTLNQFIQKSYWDEARVFKSAKQFQEGIKAPDLPINETEIYHIGADKLCYYYQTA